MRGVRLHPNYHGYTLADRAFGEAVEAATNHKLVVQIALEMEDVRTQHPLMRVPPVSVENIAALPLEATVQFLNGSSKLLPQARRLAGDRRVYFDFAMVEGMDPVGHLAAAASIQRVAFGSYAPLFYFESALLKVREAALSEMDARRVFAGNARELLDGARRQ
jgi:predicted TIM-barrel fold metal-dependent hydrolase